MKTQYHPAFHEGLEKLGKCFGADTTRSTEAGAPDVIWSFANDVHVAFEAKTEKRENGSLSKKDLQETKGHGDWVRARLGVGRPNIVVETVVVSDDSRVHPVALPFTGGVFHVKPADLVIMANRVTTALQWMRIRFSGRDFASVTSGFSSTMRANKMGLNDVMAELTANPLAQ